MYIQPTPRLFSPSLYYSQRTSSNSIPLEREKDISPSGHTVSTGSLEFLRNFAWESDEFFELADHLQTAELGDGVVGDELAFMENDNAGADALHSL